MNEALAIPEDPGYFGELTLTAYVAPPTLTFEEWTADFNRVGLVTRGIKWIAADLLLVAEERFENQSEQFFDALGYTHHTLENIRWVAKRFPHSRRRESLSFSHYEKVASKKFTDAEQDEWLEAAVANRWSVDELDAAIKTARGPVDPPSEPAPEKEELAIVRNPDGSLASIKAETFVVYVDSSKNVWLETSGLRFKFFAVNGVRITEQKVESMEASS